jgi:hypothetical protein
MAGGDVSAQLHGDAAEGRPGPVAEMTIDIHAHVVVPEAAALVRPFFDVSKDPFMPSAGQAPRTTSVSARSSVRS